MTQPKITLYYDIVSPFGYMVFYALEVSYFFFDSCTSLPCSCNCGLTGSSSSGWLVGWFKVVDGVILMRTHQ